MQHPAPATAEAQGISSTRIPIAEEKKMETMQSAAGGTSVLLQAIANPALKSAASVLLRTMEETGSISRADASVLSNFLGGCGHVGGTGWVGDGAQQQQQLTDASAGDAQVAGSKRPRQDDGGVPPQAGGWQRQEDEGSGAFPVHEYVAGNMVASNGGGQSSAGGVESAPAPIPAGVAPGSKRFYADAAEGGNGAKEKAQQKPALAAQMDAIQWDPIPINKPGPTQSVSELQSVPEHLPANKTDDDQIDAASGSALAGDNSNAPLVDGVNQVPMQQVVSSIERVPSKYTHMKRMSDPCKAACLIDKPFLPLNTKPIVGRESHTSDLAVFDRFIGVLKEAERPPSIGPFNDAFWAHIRKVLEPAVPVGFEALPSEDDVSPKGPKDCAAFLGKIVATAPVNPIHPNIIAEASDLPLETVLNELFCATKLGLVDMQWAPLCDRCGSMACAKSRLEDLPNRAYCDGCMYENTVDCLEKIKIIFTLNRDVFYVLMENFACTPSKASMAATCMFAVVPATSTGSGFRYSIGCGGDLMFCPTLEPGRYRMHCPVAKTDNYLFVRKEAAEDDEPVQLKLSVSDMVVRPGDQLKTFYAPHGMIHFDIFPDTRSLLVLWVQKDVDEHTLKYLPPEERPPFTNAKEVIEFPTFVLLFQKEVESMLLAAMTQMRQRERSNNGVEKVTN